MEVICSHPYRRVVRRIRRNEQQYVEVEELISLYEDKIVTGNHSFYINHVYDISFKPLSDETGFLYLHTNQGLFSFNVKTNPYSFIDEYKRVRRLT